MPHIFDEFEHLASKNYKIGLFFKAYKYIRPALEQIHLNPAITLEEMANNIGLDIKKATKLVKDLTGRRVITYSIRNNEWYLSMTVKGRELFQFLEK